MNNKLIRVLDVEHGKRVIAFWKQYCDTGVLRGDNVGSYYGLINGRFDYWDIYEVKKYKAKIIELPEDRNYPRVMLVSEDNINWDKQRVVFMEKCGGFLAWVNAETLEEAENETGTICWKYVKELEPIEVTLEEIAEWKKVSKELITIKRKQNETSDRSRSNS